MKARSLWLARSAVLLGTLAASSAPAQNAGHITRESVDSVGAQALGYSTGPAVSADGRFVAFSSDAPNLVPNDTNDDSDVFVRDRKTGVVQRVSVSWNGMEARDESRCPAISADGRWVAFMSRAWNLYPGGANLGHPRWDVYVHDRQVGSTTRISVSTTGGDPDGDSQCPKISANGKRVVFASVATNLIQSDGNGYSDVFLYDANNQNIRRVSRAADGGDANSPSSEPAISGNGRFVAFTSTASNLLSDDDLPINFDSQVYLRDLDLGQTELISVLTWLPGEPGDKSSSRPALSADGRFVAFESHATNLLGDFRPGGHVYLRDRQEGTTIVAGTKIHVVAGCAAPNGSGICWWGNEYQPAISADGRFVAYSSGSMLLMRPNLYESGARVYLFDRVGGRLRRISVDESGWDSASCSERAGLSGDGKLVVYRTVAGNLVPDDTNGATDVFSHEWTCNDAGRCRAFASCPNQPMSCESATSSELRLKKRPPGGVHEDQLQWRWAGAGSADPFPSPADGTYQLCLYAEERRVVSLDVAAPEAAECSGSARPCWRTLSDGYKLLDPTGGLTSLKVTGDASERRIVVHGAGALLDAPFLPLDGSHGLVVQLQETGSGRCFGAQFPASSIKRNFAGNAAHGSTNDGRLLAKLP